MRSCVSRGTFPFGAEFSLFENLAVKKSSSQFRSHFLTRQNCLPFPRFTVSVTGHTYSVLVPFLTLPLLHLRSTSHHCDGWPIIIMAALAAMQTFLRQPPSIVPFLPRSLPPPVSFVVAPSIHPGILHAVSCHREYKIARTSSSCSSCGGLGSSYFSRLPPSAFLRLRCTWWKLALCRRRLPNDLINGSWATGLRQLCARRRCVARGWPEG